ncbi:prepilin peptidase-dependent pilin [Erwinia sp.]|uniref:prepilin peptidase-dependent pilin n=1 Tax=Erwinia citreus TaxID=558 RepID=UPI003C78A7DB
MKQQQGFTLIELMIVIAIIAILSAIGLPAYQGYLQKAALTDMLQTALPYKTAVDLCAIERGGFGHCSEGSNGIPAGKGSRYVVAISINAGVISLTGKESLSDLRVVMRPNWDEAEGLISWQRSCTSAQLSLKEACENVFRFEDGASEVAE